MSGQVFPGTKISSCLAVSQLSSSRREVGLAPSMIGKMNCWVLGRCRFECSVHSRGGAIYIA